MLDILLEPILALVYPEMIEESQRGGFYENIRCWTCLCLSMMSMEVLQPDDGGDVHHGHGCLADEDVEIGTGCALQ
jgi:hypothetical protein